MSNTIIPGRPARPIQVETAGQPSVRVDAGGRIPPGGTAGQNLIKASDSDYATLWGTATAAAAWGAITGTLASQADLQAALDGKQPFATVLTNTTASFTTAQETKLAGIATGATANATDAALRDRATHTGTQLAATISDLAAAVAATAAVTANTAKVTNATHTGDVTGATALTIANDAVTNAKLANMATASIKGRATAGTGDPEDLTGTQATALLDIATTTLKGLAPARSGVATEYLDGTGGYSTPAGGGGATANGSAIIDFGAAPGTNTAEAIVTTAIPVGAVVRAWFQSEGNADHNEIEHRLIFPSRVGLTCGAIVDGVSFTIYAETELRLTGDVSCRWQWSA